jgi:hypothetical protein
MTKDNPTDDEIRRADGVILLDRVTRWREACGQIRVPPPDMAGTSPVDSGYTLYIPVDSTDEAKLQEWRDRIIRLR